MIREIFYGKEKIEFYFQMIFVTYELQIFGLEIQ